MSEENSLALTKEINDIIFHSGKPDSLVGKGSLGREAGQLGS